MLRQIAFTLTLSAAPWLALAANAAPWSEVVTVDRAHPYHFVTADGSRPFIFCKTAWHYFSARRPEITLARARALGANVLRVGLECAYYSRDLGYDAWPWGGTRQAPDYGSFNEAYWDEVDRRLEAAAAQGVGVNLTLFTSLHLPDTEASFEIVRPYLDRALHRLGRHPNLFCWEVHNEHIANPRFQQRVGEYLKTHDPHRRPVISSDGTTDFPLWPRASWMDMAVVHHCTGAQPEYDLRDWYLAIARNLRGHGKPGFINETGRERRHRNDDPVHRRKQLWLQAAAGIYTTWHSWDGCEGIDDPDYAAPGESFVAPFSQWWSAQPFWRLAPEFSALQIPPTAPWRDDLVPVVLAGEGRDVVLAYLFTRRGGQSIDGGSLRLRLPAGDYRVEFFHPATGLPAALSRAHVSPGLREARDLDLPVFTDDLALRLTRLVEGERVLIPGTQ